MIQVGKIRAGSGFSFIKNFKFPNIDELFTYIEKAIPEYVSEEENYNLYFTVAHHLREQRKGDSFQCQQVIAFDIDGIELDKIDNYPPLIAQALGLDLSKCGLVYSGNGIHLYIKLKSPISDRVYFEKAKAGYNSLCKKINETLAQAGLSGSTDTTAWDSSRVLRLPFTRNVKTKDGIEVIRDVKLINGKMEAIDYDLPLEEAPKNDKVNFLQGNTFPSPDIKTISKECEFIKWCTEKPNEVHEPDMYAFFSILGHSNEGRSYALDFAEKNFSSPSIDACDKEAKLHQAITVTGPRTCAGIVDLKGLDLCKNCKHYNKITSPIQIKGEDFIGTAHLGFTLKGPRGSNIRQYNDLLLYYDREHLHKSIGAIKKIYVWTGTHYKLTNEVEIKNYAHNKFIPLATSEEANEFYNLVKRSNYQDESFLEGNKAGLINLANGILDLSTGEIKPHNKGNNFLYCLPYNYNPSATAPMFEKFLSEITLNRPCLRNILLEYMGYIISGSPYIYQKALIMDGQGKNGKTTLLKVIKKLTGRENVANISLESLIGNVFASSGLHGKLVNISEEEPAKSFAVKNGVFKNLTGDGTVNAQYKYGDAFEFDNRAKLIITYNELPWLADTSKGMLRRLLIVPFDYDLESEHADKVNPNIDADLANEMEGIFNLALEGYYRLTKQKGFTKSEYVDYKIDEVHNYSDVTKSFVENYIKFTNNEDDKVDRNRVYELYSEFYKDNFSAGSTPLSKIGLSKKLQRLGVKSKKTSTVVNGEKINKTNYVGIRLINANNPRF